MAKLTFNEPLCKGCSLCVDVCPKKILHISSHTNDKGYHVVTCEDITKCIACASCARMCPDSVITVER